MRSSNNSDYTCPIKFTVIVATYDAILNLSSFLNSYAHQTYESKELIVIDGGSTDGTYEVINNHTHIIDYWISEPDRGIYQAWNKGLAHATGDWICFLGADDFLWSPDVLSILASRLSQINPSSTRFVYGRVAILNSQDEVLELAGEEWVTAKRRFRQVMSIPHPGLLHHRSLFEQSGTFREDFRIAGDYEFLLRHLPDGNACFIRDLTVVGMRMGGLSSRPENILKQLMEVRRAQKLHGITFPPPLWLLSVGRSIIRVMLWKTLGEETTCRLLDLGRRMMGKPSHWTRL